MTEKMTETGKDIVEELKTWGDCFDFDHDVLDNAIEEIEKLRGELSELKAANGSLQAMKDSYVTSKDGTKRYRFNGSFDLECDCDGDGEFYYSSDGGEESCFLKELFSNQLKLKPLPKGPSDE